MFYFLSNEPIMNLATMLLLLLFWRCISNSYYGDIFIAPNNKVDELLKELNYSSKKVSVIMKNVVLNE